MSASLLLRSCVVLLLAGGLLVSAAGSECAKTTQRGYAGGAPPELVKDLIGGLVWEGVLGVRAGAHDLAATCVAMDMEGGTVVSGSSDGTCRVWTYPRLEQLSVCFRCSEPVNSLVLNESRGWACLVTRSRTFSHSNAVGIDFRSGRVIWQSRLPHVVTAAAQRLADSGAYYLGADSGKVLALDTQSGRVLWERKVQEDAVASLAFCPSLRALMIVDSRGGLRLASDAGELSAMSVASTATVVAVAACDAGFCCVSRDGEVRMLSVGADGLYSPWVAHVDGGPVAVCCSAEGEAAVATDAGKIVVVGPNGVARSWDGTSGHVVQMTWDGTSLATAGMRPCIALWDAASGHPLSPVSRWGQWRHVVSLGESRLLAVDASDEAGLWSLEDCGLKWRVALPEPSACVSVAHGEPFMLAVGGALYSIGRATGSSVAAGRLLTPECELIELAATTSDGTYWAYGLLGSASIHVESARGGTKWELSTGPVSSLDLAEDGSALAAVSHDGRATLRLWDVRLGKVMHTLGTGISSAIAFSPDGKRLAAGADGRVLLFDLQARPLPRTLELPTDCSEAALVAWRPDGSRLVVATRGRELYVWDGHGEQLLNRIALGGEPTALGYAGRRIVVAFSNGTISIYQSR